MEQKLTETLQRPLYDNCVMLDLTGEMLCRTSQKRATWYLTNNLATLVRDDPLTFQLNFVPKGKSHSDEFYKQERENQCVVCGSKQNLTRHHVIPYCFRHYFPREWCFHQSYDILPLCRECHLTYESAANQLKEVISQEMDINPKIVVDKKLNRAIISARALVGRATRTRKSHREWAQNRFQHQIPENRRKVLLKDVQKYLGKTEISTQELLKIQTHSPYTFPAEQIVDKLIELDPFIFRWRRHFLDVMNPKFMPKYWTIEGKTT